MRRTKLILASTALVVPVAFAVHLRAVNGSEPPGRLVVSADGLAVTDTVTGLVWERSGSSSSNSSAGATSICTSFSAGTVGAPWRLPTVKELVSIVDFESATSPMIDTAAFPGTSVGGGAVYWTSETSGVAGLFVSFSTGQVAQTSDCCALNNQPVRCVHSAVTDGGVP